MKFASQFLREQTYKKVKAKYGFDRKFFGHGRRFPLHT